MRAVSLLYHDVVEPGEYDASGRRGATQNRFKMRTALFESHLSAIARARSEAPRTIYEVASSPELETLPVMLTFDDGGVSARTHIADRLEALGWRGHFFIIGDQLGEPGFLSRSDIRSLRERGHVIGTHSQTHPSRMSHLSSDQLVREWTGSAELLGEVLGEPVRVGSVPGGFYSRAVARAASAAGLRYLFTSEPTTRVQQVENCLVLGRYSLFGESPAETAGRFTAADRRLRARQWAYWNTKKALKLVGGRGYLWARRQLISRRSGDS